MNSIIPRWKEEDQQRAKEASQQIKEIVAGGPLTSRLEAAAAKRVTDVELGEDKTPEENLESDSKRGGASKTFGDVPQV